MADALKQARHGVGRGAYDVALVSLWNAIEPARLSGDRAALRAIESLSRQIIASGDEGQKREAERLLETLSEAVEHGVVAATARLDADVSASGDAMIDDLQLGEPGAGQADGPEAEVEGRRGIQIGSLFWLLIVVAVIVLNVLEGLGD